MWHVAAWFSLLWFAWIKFVSWNSWINKTWRAICFTSMSHYFVASRDRYYWTKCLYWFCKKVQFIYLFFFCVSPCAQVIDISFLLLWLILFNFVSNFTYINFRLHMDSFVCFSYQRSEKEFSEGQKDEPFNSAWRGHGWAAGQRSQKSHCCQVWRLLGSFCERVRHWFMNLNEVMRFYIRVGTAFMKHTYNLQM